MEENIKDENEAIINNDQIINENQEELNEPHPEKYLGVTPPLSYDQPTESELLVNDDMVNYLHKRGDVFESTIGQKIRLEVITKLQEIIKIWTIKVGTEKNINEEYLINGGGVTLKIFGSTRLGVHSPDADIDTLCIAPNYITRQEFFSSYCNIMKNHQDVTNFSSIPEAYTPVIKFNINGQAIDMIFVSLAIPMVPIDFNLLDAANLIGLDEQSK
jgi:poly(A) polymerase